MAKKEYNYFDQFVSQVTLCKKAAGQLSDMLADYTDVFAKANAIHDTEHEADMVLHEISRELNKSFITPIDREDIIDLAMQTDDIADSIEDVANLFDMMGIEEIKPEAKAMVKLILTGCEKLCEAVEEFAHFKVSKKLNDLIIEVNHIEEEGDRVHRGFIKALYKDEKDPITLMKWKEILDSMEKVLDDCEDVADLLDGLAIKNS